MTISGSGPGRQDESSAATSTGPTSGAGEELEVDSEQHGESPAPTSTGSTSGAGEELEGDSEQHGESPAYTIGDVRALNASNARQRDSHSGEQDESLLGTIRVLTGSLGESDSHWHFSISAPRWALHSRKASAGTTAVAAAVAVILASLGFWLGWHATNQLKDSKAALAVQIGPWAVTGALLVGAGIAAYAAMGNGRLQMRLTKVKGKEAAASALAASASGHPPPSDAAAGAAAAGQAAQPVAVAARVAADALAKGQPNVPTAAANVGLAPAHAAAATAKDPATTISPKVWAGSIAGAISFSFWTIAAATFWKHAFSADVLAALVGSTTAIVGAAAAHLTTDPLRVKP